MIRKSSRNNLDGMKIVLLVKIYYFWVLRETHHSPKSDTFYRIFNFCSTNYGFIFFIDLNKRFDERTKFFSRNLPGVVIIPKFHRTLWVAMRFMAIQIIWKPFLWYRYDLISPNSTFLMCGDFEEKIIERIFTFYHKN